MVGACRQISKRTLRYTPNLLIVYVLQQPPTKPIKRLPEPEIGHSWIDTQSRRAPRHSFRARPVVLGHRSIGVNLVNLHGGRRLRTLRAVLYAVMSDAPSQTY